MLVEDVAESGLESASIVKPPFDCSSTRTRILWSMLHGTSILASRCEERVQKAALIDHHGPGDGRHRHATKASPRDGMRRCGVLGDGVGPVIGRTRPRSRRSSKNDEDQRIHDGLGITLPLIDLHTQESVARAEGMSKSSCVQAKAQGTMPCPTVDHTTTD